MPTTASEFAQTAQEQTLKTVRQSQQVIVEGVRTWANAVERAIPETPPIPFADEFPTPHELVKSGFEFAEQLLKTQRQFAESVLDAAAPVLGKPAPKAKVEPKE
ncbi:MAG TPA: hypothetical protein VGJ25_06795 [Gaiellaceae bacterium]|jgi:hypothetical protein